MIFSVLVVNDLWPFNLKFAPTVTRVQDHISTKFEVSAAFWFWVNRRHGTNRRTDGRTEGVQRYMREPDPNHFETKLMPVALNIHTPYLIVVIVSRYWQRNTEYWHVAQPCRMQWRSFLWRALRTPSTWQVCCRCRRDNCSRWGICHVTGRSQWHRHAVDCPPCRQTNAGDHYDTTSRKHCVKT